ncbi:LCP family protein [Sporolactobacillus pectinivorans]|uniref:LCP family protein n=1 Tax=Sporolactobacillus pectinivorans TaxID=1591408 RepID=UPI000C258728|nr:LCP family protein [Sporolactobacillus pectinivorans]
MARKNSPEESRSQKGVRKRHRFLRYILVILAVLLIAAASCSAYEYYNLRPQHHFNNLPSIGKTTSKIKERTGTFNLLLMGSDARPGDPAGHSDSLLLVHANLNNHTYNILSIPRDTRVYMPGVGYTKLTSVNYMDQLNHGIKQGSTDAVAAISQLTGVPINYFAETNNWGFQDMVDSIGGIDMTLPFDVTLTHPWYPQDKNKTFTAGTHALNGQMVNEIVHERDSVPGTDYGRQQLQEAALIGIAKKVGQPANVTKLPSLLGSVSKYLIATNMTQEDMISAGLSVMSHLHLQQQIHYLQIKGTNEVLYDDMLKSDNDEVVLDPSQLQSLAKKYFMN